MVSRLFDLNIEQILQDWDVHHAIREVIANALDEQKLTGTKEIIIFKDDDGAWHIKDFGRGLQYEHLTQNENEEKLKTDGIIGKFGIGLKDALATFERNDIKVKISSKYGTMTLEQASKEGFDDITTLHVRITDTVDSKFEGTEFILPGVSDTSMKRAKDLFLKFSGDKEIETTTYGCIFEKSGTAKIFINGVRVAEEENFLFSYNITSLTKEIKKALNRERSNVGRSAYSGRVKQILLKSTSETVANKLVEDLQNYVRGTLHDEVTWIDVQKHAVKILNALKKVVFVTPEEMMNETMMIDEAKESGFTIVSIPENLRDSIRNTKDLDGNPIRELDRFQQEYQEEFSFEFIDPDDLTVDENKILGLTDKIFALIGGKPLRVKSVKITEKMRREMGMLREPEGLWDPKTKEIIIKRNQLHNLMDFGGTLLHEAAHVISDKEDTTRAFENELTRLLGLLVGNFFKDMQN